MLQYADRTYYSIIVFLPLKQVRRENLDLDRLHLVYFYLEVIPFNEQGT